MLASRIATQEQVQHLKGMKGDDEVSVVLAQAVEQSEKPWLMLLTSLSALSAILLALVFWKLYQMQVMQLPHL